MSTLPPQGLSENTNSGVRGFKGYWMGHIQTNNDDKKKENKHGL
jgi:hypothetical protein